MCSLPGIVLTEMRRQNHVGFCVCRSSLCVTVRSVLVLQYHICHMHVENKRRVHDQKGVKVTDSFVLGATEQMASCMNILFVWYGNVRMRRYAMHVGQEWVHSAYICFLYLDGFMSTFVNMYVIQYDTWRAMELHFKRRIKTWANRQY